MSSNNQQRLQNRLQWESYTEIKMKSDGNCQFRALSHQLYKTADFHQRVRKEIVQQLTSRPKLYKEFVEKEYSRYVKDMSNDAEWGDEVTLTAAANLYGVKIVVITSMENIPFFVYLPKSGKEPDRTIHLSHLENAHYNSIHLNKDSDTSSMELQEKKNETKDKDKKKNKEEMRQEKEKEREEKKEKEKENKNKKEKPTVTNYQKKINYNLQFFYDTSMALEREYREEKEELEEEEQEEKIPRYFQFSDFM